MNFRRKEKLCKIQNSFLVFFAGRSMELIFKKNGLAFKADYYESVYERLVTTSAKSWYIRESSFKWEQTRAITSSTLDLNYNNKESYGQNIYIKLMFYIYLMAILHATDARNKDNHGYNLNLQFINIFHHTKFESFLNQNS